MTLNELETVFERIGGHQWDADSADRLVEKACVLEQAGLGVVVARMARAVDVGNFLGSLSEVNFAAAFIDAGDRLQPDVVQQAPKDIDFLWRAAGHDVFIEVKRLGQHRDDEQRVRRQIAGVPEPMGPHLPRTQDSEIGRVQRDIIAKAQKYAAAIPAGVVNVVAVDVCELIGRMMDVGDCLLAAGGLPLALRHYRDPFPNPVGVFEDFNPDALDEGQRRWVDSFHRVAEGQPQPRDVLHGVLFLFRDPPQRTHLHYSLRGCVVWNSRLAESVNARDVEAALYRIIPFVGW